MPIVLVLSLNKRKNYSSTSAKASSLSKTGMVKLSRAVTLLSLTPLINKGGIAPSTFALRRHHSQMVKPIVWATALLGLTLID